MKYKRILTAVALSPFLVNCGALKYGGAETEAILKELKPIPGRTSLYVCREPALFVGAANRPTAVVDGQPIGTLKPNSFVHAVVDPGLHNIYLERNPGGQSGTLTIHTQAGEVAIVWAGITGAGFGVLTVDNFPDRQEAEQRVKRATYVVPADR